MGTWYESGGEMVGGAHPTGMAGGWGNGIWEL